MERSMEADMVEQDEIHEALKDEDAQPGHEASAVVGTIRPDTHAS
jgi:hypothetical protein